MPASYHQPNPYLSIGEGESSVGFGSYQAASHRDKLDKLGGGEEVAPHEHREVALSYAIARVNCGTNAAPWERAEG
jgi:hypothetical protein